jgi:hypothetical protein
MHVYLKVDKDIRMIRIENMLLPPVSLGTSPFLGAGQFGRRAQVYYRRFYLQPENMISLIIKAAELGIRAVQLVAYKGIIEAFKEAQERISGKLHSTVVIGLEDWQRELMDVTQLKPAIIFIHARLSDSLNFSLMSQICQEIRERGLIPGCATHFPERTIASIDREELDIKAYLAPVNSRGLFMGPSPDKALEVIKQTNKIVIAKKVLAAGNLPPEEGIAYISGIGHIKGLALGIASEREAEETFHIALKYYD